MVKKSIASKDEKSNILENITADDALSILKILAEEDNNIRERIERITEEYLNKVDLEDVASDVYFQLDSLEIEDINLNCGPFVLIFEIRFLRLAIDRFF